MSYSSVGAVGHASSEQTGIDTYAVTDEGPGRDVLEALGDRHCRTILRSTSDEPLTAKEIADTHDYPLSTTYRKVDTLVESGLLDELVRIRESGKHVSEYVPAIDGLVVDVEGDGGLLVRVARRGGADSTLLSHLSASD